MFDGILLPTIRISTNFSFSFDLQICTNMATAYYSSSTLPTLPTLPTLQTNDVFISSRGSRFVNLLHASLRQKEIQSYIDCKLQRGDEISGSLMKAIQESKLSIIIFSENYANSSRCLDELANVLECQINFGQLVVPVFHGVDPSDVRKQRRAYAAAFDMHEQHFQHGTDKLQRWREALTRAGELCGWDSRMYRYLQFLFSTYVYNVSHILFWFCEYGLSLLFLNDISTTKLVTN